MITKEEILPHIVDHGTGRLNGCASVFLFVLELARYIHIPGVKVLTARNHQD